MKHLSEIQHQGLLWVNITKQDEKILKSIQNRFKFEDQEIQESLPPIQRPKMVKKSDHYFMILHFPVFDRKTRRLGFTEIDFFINQNSLITIHDNRLPVIEGLFRECQKVPAMRSKYFDGTAVHILFELLERLLDAVFPILLHVNEDINTVDKKLFAKIPDRSMAEEILRLKTNVVNFRRTMQGHKTVLERLVMHSGRELDLSSYQWYLNILREYTNEIWLMLESQKESVNALHETNESLVSLRMNQIMKTLTVISVITFPLTLLATMFSIQARGTPLVNDPFGFWLITGVTLLFGFCMLWIFLRKKWI